MEPVEVDLQPHTKGDTWLAPLSENDPGGLTIGPVLFGTEAPPAPLKSCRLYFRKKVGGAFGYGFQYPQVEGFGRFTILDAATWHIWLPPQLLPLEVGVWSWDFETIDTSDVVRTLYFGELSVKKDISNDNDN